MTTLSVQFSDLPEIRIDEATVRKVWRAAETLAAAAGDGTVVEQCRIRIAYRLVREWARTLGLIDGSSALSGLSVDRFLLPQLPATTPPPGAFPIRAYAVVRNRMDTPARYDIDPDGPPVDRGLPLLPSKQVLEHQPTAECFAEALSHVAVFLRVTETDYGRVGMNGLCSLPPHGWPDADVLYAYEGILVDEILTILVTKSQRDAEQHLQNDHGMLPHEARGLVRLAKLEARDRMEAEIEEDRAVLAMRLEDLIVRSKSTLDMRVELGAIKQLAIVKGVTRSEPEDTAHAFADVVRRVANEARPDTLPSVPTHALPPA